MATQTAEWLPSVTVALGRLSRQLMEYSPHLLRLAGHIWLKKAAGPVPSAIMRLGLILENVRRKKSLQEVIKFSSRSHMGISPFGRFPSPRWRNGQAFVKKHSPIGTPAPESLSSSGLQVLFARSSSITNFPSSSINSLSQPKLEPRMRVPPGSRNFESIPSYNPLPPGKKP